MNTTQFHGDIRAIKNYLSEHHVFSAGERPHYYIDNSYVAAGRIFDILQVIADSTVTYVNLSGGDNASALSLPAGDIIYGRFADSSIVIAPGGLLRAYEAVAM